MGRQAFLTRLALGRSAFEPLEQRPSIEDRINGSSQHDVDQGSSDRSGAYAHRNRQQVPRATEYVQQYDERGYPCNPEARARASQLRQAQNDVLAAVGVVKRRDDQAKEDRSLAAKIAEDRQKLEDIVGTYVDINALGLLICTTWWLESIRLRFLVFSYPPNFSIFDILNSERRVLGSYAFFIAGLPARAFYHLLFEGVETCVETLLMHLDRLLIATVQSRTHRNRYRTYISSFGTILNSAARILLSPLFVYSHLQRLHLIPASPKLPNWRSLIPFSESSPLQLLPTPTTFTGQGLRSWMWSMLTFPTTIYLALLVVDYVDEFSFTELPRPGIIAPTNEDGTIKNPAKFGKKRDEPSKSSNNTMAQILDRVCISRNRFLQALGWIKGPSRHLRKLQRTHQPSSSFPPTDTDEYGDGTNTPSSETMSVYTDAMETHTQTDPDPTFSSANFTDTGTLEVQEGSGRVQRVSELSLAPAAFLSNQVESMLVEWAFVPIEAIMMRGLVFAFLSTTSRLSAEQQANAGFMKEMVYPVLSGPVISGALGLVGATRGIGLGNLHGRTHSLWGGGNYLARIGLTWAAQIAVGLSLWGLEWAVVRAIGKKFFSWGAL